MTTKNINTWLGWLTFLVAMITYTLTVERTASFWDCGEFISASYHLQVVHPPGAPLFLLLGNLFSKFASGPESVALMVNLLSAFTSALCVMFTFWTITHFAEKLVRTTRFDESSGRLLIFGSGLVGALALTFSDTFWFSAVEAEVYAASSFFTAITFWCILKWEHASETPLANRWLILISYLIGLGIGVHLLNLLVIPAVVYVYYFKKQSFSRMGFLKASGIGLAILGFVQVGIIPGLPTLAAWFDRVFVNDYGMGFGSGILFLAALLTAGIVYGLWYTHKKRHTVMNLALLCFSFILIGYSSYAMVVIRSLANPPIDMNNPEEPFNLVSYLNREQYGERALLKGPYFNAQAVDIEEGKQQWRKGAEGYEDAGIEPEYIWDPKYVTYFPRMGDQQKASSPKGYENWTNAKSDKKPTFGQNIEFFIKYQLGHMYWRYFLWNFAGRQGMKQGDGELTNGNWMSGITPLDETRLGPQKNLPDAWANDKARNSYFLLPLILGLMGFIFQFTRNKNDFFVVTMLFLFTGILIAVYLNAPPFEPRERDYTLVGSFQIFCIWIGLGVIQLADWVMRWLKSKQAVVAAITVSMLAAPVIMVAQNWDDHDRSERVMVPEYGKNYLESCEPNAILFTNGDNDTYPLWYVQNVEGYRTDVRVVNLQLLNFDWYVEALTRQVMDSKPFQLSVPKEKYAKGLREQLRFEENPKSGINPNEHYPVDQVIAFINNDDPAAKRPWYFNQQVNYVPVRKVKIVVDKDKAVKSGAVRPQDVPYLVDEMRLSLDGSALLKADWVLLDLIQQNNFERPIYFASNSVSGNHLGMGAYMRMDGLAYRLLPLLKPRDPRMPVNLDSDIFYTCMMDSFNFGGVNDPNVLLDEQTIRMVGTFRNYFGLLATQLAIEGKKDSLKNVLARYMSELPPTTIPYEFSEAVVPMAQACYMVGEMEKGDKLLNGFFTEQEQIWNYLNSFQGAKKRLVATQIATAAKNLQEIYQVAQQYNRTEIALKTSPFVQQQPGQIPAP